MKSLFLFFSVIVAVWVGSVLVYAAEVRTTVKYISASAIYLDAGRTQGVRVGDRADVLRHDSLLAVLEVVFVADRSSSCRRIESPGTIQVGDEVVIRVAVQQSGADTSRSQAVELFIPSKSDPTIASVSKRTMKANRVSGHAGFEVLWQEDRTGSANHFTQPALGLRLRIENVLATRHTLSVRMRGRQTLREREVGDHTDNRWTGRIYEVSLYYDNPQSVFHYGLGRVLTNQLRGIGYFDGALVDYRATEHVTVGLFGGAEPDPRTTEINASETKFGVFGSLESGPLATRRFRSTLALAGRYANGHVRREYLYEQADYSVGARWWILQSAEVNINRDRRKSRGPSRVELANALVSIRYSVSPALNASISYDNRIRDYTWESRETPDSLFTDGRRQGLQLGVRWRALKGLRIGTGYGLRTSQSQSQDARTYSADAALQNALVKGVTASLAVVGFSNSFASGLQPSLSLSKYLSPSLLTGLQVGRNDNQFRSPRNTIVNNWVKLRTDASFTTRLYGSAYLEHYEGDSPSLNRLFLETGVRW